MRLRDLFIMAALVTVGLQNVYSQQNTPPPAGSMSGTFFVKPTELPASYRTSSFSDAIFESNPVINAPFSAEAVNESITVLADGNRIVKGSTTKIYRDSEGKTRRETVGSSPVGVTVVISTPFGPVNASPSVSTSQPQIQISDPVAGVSYVLDPETHTAKKYKTFPSDPKIAAAIARAKQEMTSTGKNSVTIRDGNTSVSVSTASSSSIPFPTESLGTMTIEGVECEGTRMSSTIPAGQIGNEKPIVITSESWISPKLQVEVLTKRFDPRSGENTFKLINIDQSKPPAALFQVPADYTIIDMAEKAKEAAKGTDTGRN
jgi:hypothetical protein